ncbi:MAG: hypothetical protein COU11_03035 [Candidatus Harrisonbacteria bacterium CG10_big_fil_rev_8_21_14_0_10_49_15]|uniref:Uncharacterized protein n=1 Tax=Candidatus Harrisonbacteria bacterium CG10_big_fil_rev_8_21_14_0_10_49_15 TaxID=1974587 RepID=A0A2H0UKM7_9BACT|nr:MAG: hypothetical protein COU11_03035 [Candidatus Harrisonbacteria bacterium CG10_big_fil_rev_8_21_14_0_10_49_15]
MRYKGVVTKEGLKDEGFLNFATDLREENGYIHFTADTDFAPAIVSEMKEALKTGPYYAVIKTEYELNIIFAEKVVTAKPTETEPIAKAIQYGVSLEIPESELRAQTGI